MPGGADLYPLKFILYDWNDDRAAATLANIRKAITPEGRLVVVETVLETSRMSGR